MTDEITEGEAVKKILVQLEKDLKVLLCPFGVFVNRDGGRFHFIFRLNRGLSNEKKLSVVKDTEIGLMASPNPLYFEYLAHEWAQKVIVGFMETFEHIEKELGCPLAEKK